MSDKYLQHMSGALQENVLTLLCFDSDASKLIRLMVDVELFEGNVYKDIAEKAIAFLDQYGDAIKEHLPDVLEDKITSSDRRVSKIYRQTLENLYAAKEHMNSAYIVEQVQTFVHEQRLKVGLLKAVEHIEAGRVSEAEVAIEDSLRNRTTSFSPGTFFSDTKESLKFLSILDDGIPLGIKELDAHGIMPAPETMFLLIAPAKKGKSWFCVHVGKYGILQRKRVLHVTLENSEALTLQRYAQNLFSISKREALHRLPQFRRTESGLFAGIDFSELERPALSQPNIRKFLEQSIRERFKTTRPLLVKNFPTGSLTVQDLRAYLDALERLHKWIPDIIIIDYPDLMKITGTDKRIEIGEIFKSLRGLFVERKVAGVVVTQGNRDAALSRTTSDTQVAEDYSKVATADTVITYSQTIEEKRLGLARLFVSNARNDKDKFSTLITQCYDLGQFCLDSMPMNDGYFDALSSLYARAPEREEAAA